MYDAIIARPGEAGENDELLTQHSADVAELAPQLGSQDIAELVEIVGQLHDFGKATTYFQHHVRGKPVSETARTYHARLGAFAAFYVLTKLGYDDRERLAGLLSILRHHGRLPDAAEFLVTITKAEQKESSEAYLSAQIDDIDEYNLGRTVADTLLEAASGGELSWESFSEAMRDGVIYDDVIELVGDRKGEVKALALLIDPAPESLPGSLYDRTIRVWSLLTLADKTCSAGLKDDRRLRPATLTLDDLENHIADERRGLPNPPEFSEDDPNLGDDASDEATLNQLREGIRRLVKKNAQSFAEREDRVATLTLPTGLGKTFTGITAAYTIRDTIQHEELGEKHPPRVIYALPYTSIIEQTRTVFENALNADPTGRAFTVHHYLNDTVTYPDVEDGETDQATDDTKYFDVTRFAESWRGGTALTTFVQLFESLAGPTNARGLKLPALHDSIIVLDEPQTLPKNWWPAIRYLVTLLTTEYNAHVISMTATQPSLFHNTGYDVPSLLSQSGHSSPPIERAAFDAVSRTTYRIDDSITSDTTEGVEQRSHESAGVRVVDTATKSDSTTSVLAVCNTIESASTLATAAETAARETGSHPQHIGSTYRDVLENDPPTSPDTIQSDGLERARNVDDLAESTLKRLGFDTDRSGEDITDWNWEYDGPSDTVLVGEFSSRYRPRDRRVLVTIATIIARTTQPFILVSTQAVEAGVDISFSAVFRDLAPLDNIVQAAGRCNRSFEWGLTGGTVTVWSLAPTDDTADPPATYIYPQKELTEVSHILEDLCEAHDSRTISDTTVETEAIPKYFEWVAAEGEPDVEDRELTHALEHCQGNTLASKSLIDSGYETRDVIVAHTPTERAAVHRLTELLRTDSKDKVRGFELLNQLNDLRVSVPIDQLDDTTTITRIDGRAIADTEGVDVLKTTDAGADRFYDLANGGLRITNVINDRFSF